MTINSPRIAGKPAIERRRLPGIQPMTVYPVAPNTQYRELDSQGFMVSKTVPDPEAEGQVYLHYFSDSTNLNRRMQMYVAVDINGTPTWKLVSNTTQLNKWTGKPYDPIFDG